MRQSTSSHDNITNLDTRVQTTEWRRFTCRVESVDRECVGTMSWMSTLKSSKQEGSVSIEDRTVWTIRSEKRFECSIKDDGAKYRSSLQNGVSRKSSVILQSAVGNTSRRCQAGAKLRDFAAVTLKHKRVGLSVWTRDSQELTAKFWFLFLCFLRGGRGQRKGGSERFFSI